jgi:hypothetical protein
MERLAMELKSEKFWAERKYVHCTVAEGCTRILTHFVVVPKEQ